MTSSAATSPPIVLPALTLLIPFDLIGRPQTKHLGGPMPQQRREATEDSTRAQPPQSMRTRVIVDRGSDANYLGPSGPHAW